MALCYDTAHQLSWFRPWLWIRPLSPTKSHKVSDYAEIIRAFCWLHFFLLVLLAPSWNGWKFCQQFAPLESIKRDSGSIEAIWNGTYFCFEGFKRICFSLSWWNWVLSPRQSVKLHSKRFSEMFVWSTEAKGQISWNIQFEGHLVRGMQRENSYMSTLMEWQHEWRRSTNTFVFGLFT